MRRGGLDSSRLGLNLLVGFLQRAEREMALPYMTSARILNFLTLSPLVMFTLFMQPRSFCLLFMDPSPLECGRHIWKPPNGKWVVQIVIIFL